MPFGKYQDVELTDVPRPYLYWLRRQNWLGAWLAEKIDAILTGEKQPPICKLLNDNEELLRREEN